MERLRCASRPELGLSAGRRTARPDACYSSRYSGGGGSATRRKTAGAEHVAPASVQAHEAIGVDPGVRARSFALLVGPPSDRARAFAVVRQRKRGEALRELARAFHVTALPALEVRGVREEVALLRVAAVVREHEVVAEIDGIARPRDEVIDAARAAQLLAAIEAPPSLVIAQHGAKAVEAGALAAEQERREVGAADQRPVRGDARDLPQPRAAHGVEHETVERAERRGHSGQQADHFRRELRLAIEELVALAADGLELPERHRGDRARHPRDERVPAQLRRARARQRRVRCLRGRDRVDHRGLPARVLQQHDPGPVERAIRARLRPVVLDELLGDRAQRHAQRAVGRGLALEAQIRERVQQRELVGRDEVAFGEQALKFPQKLELADRGVSFIGRCFASTRPCRAAPSVCRRAGRSHRLGSGERRARESA